jgi:saccharopine dehydrogenase-like NADP-dependent oxidoreductase
MATRPRRRNANREQNRGRAVVEMTTHRVLVLGGYGFFGRRICTALAKNSAVNLFIAGRDGGKGAQLANELGIAAEKAFAVDAHAKSFASVLQHYRIDTLVNTAGPFQQQNYEVPLATIAAKCNYIDLADSREFVTGIDALDATARENGVTVVSGASSVPSLTSAVIDRFLPEFDRLESVRIGIASGAKSPGIATVRGIFSYCGKPFAWKDRGRWTTTYGWLDLSRHRFPTPVGTRLLGSCNVPDLSIIPSRYPSVQTATFQAGFASHVGHLVVWALAGLVKRHALRSAVPFASILNRISGWIEPFVSDKGAMFVQMEGRGIDGTPLRRTWNIVAKNNHGPNIPCGASIAIVNKLAAGESLPKGAMPCVGLITVDEYLASLRHLDIAEVIE